MTFSIAEDLMQSVLARLTLPSSIVGRSGQLRRTHRTFVTRETAPAVHLIDGRDHRREAKNCETARELEFTVRIIEIDSDNGFANADARKLDIMARLDPEATAYVPYPHGARLELRDVTREDEVGDQDLLAIDMALCFDYESPGRFAL